MFQAATKVVTLYDNSNFRNHFKVGLTRLCRCGRKKNSTIAQGAKLAYRTGIPLITKSEPITGPASVRH